MHEKVHPLVVVMLHQMINGSPSVLFIKRREDDMWTLMHDHMRVREQPYGAGLRVINSTLDLGLKNVRLRCYFCNTIYGETEDDHTLAIYYTLKLREEEIKLLNKMLCDNMDTLRLKEYKWVSVREPKLEELDEGFDSNMSYCWETMRKAIASNYGVRVSK